MRSDDEKGGGAKMKCRWKATDCGFPEKNEGNKPCDVDCLMCLALSFKKVAETYAVIIGSVGAGRFAGDFLEEFIALYLTRTAFLRLSKKLFPEIWEEAEKEVKKAARSGVVVMPPRGLPKEVEEALKRYLKRGETGRV